MHFAIDDPKAATVYSKTKAFVSEGVEVKEADHDFDCGLGAHASVTSMYNIGKDPGTCYALCPVRHNLALTICLTQTTRRRIFIQWGRRQTNGVLPPQVLCETHQQ